MHKKRGRAAVPVSRFVAARAMACKAKTRLIRKTNRSCPRGPEFGASISRRGIFVGPADGRTRRKGQFVEEARRERRLPQMTLFIPSPLIRDSPIRSRVRLSEGNFAGIGAFFCRARGFLRLPPRRPSGWNYYHDRTGVQVFQDERYVNTALRATRDLRRDAGCSFRWKRKSRRRWVLLNVPWGAWGCMSVDCKPFDAASSTHNVANESIGKFVAIGILNCKKLYALDFFFKVIL